MSDACLALDGETAGDPREGRLLGSVIVGMNEVSTTADDLVGLPPEDRGDGLRAPDKATAVLRLPDHVRGVLGQESVAGLAVRQALHGLGTLRDVAERDRHAVAGLDRSDIEAMGDARVIVGVLEVVQHDRLPGLDHR